MRSQDAPPLKAALDALTDAGRATDFRATDANIAAAQVFAGVSVVGAARSRCNSLPRRVQRHGDGVSVVGAARSRCNSLPRRVQRHGDGDGACCALARVHPAPTRPPESM